MNSNNTPTHVAAVATAPEYTPLHIDGWKHEWKVRHNIIDADTAETAEILDSVTARISDYYYAESTKTKTPVYPRHHALILAALGSSSKLVSQAFPATIVTGYERTRSATPCLTSSSTITKLASTYQKHHLVALAGMTGLLVTRLFMLITSITSINSLKTKKKHAEITQQYIHSALAAEYLVGNRYSRPNLSSFLYALCDHGGDDGVNDFQQQQQQQQQRAGSKYPVGADDNITPDAIRTTQEELHQLYNANIERLSAMVKQYKRGFVGRRDIREDREFVRMMSAFWRISRQLINLMKEFDGQAANPLTEMWFSTRKNARRITIVTMIAETAVIVPRLYDYDIAHIFDSANCSYANYIHTAKATWLRLAGDGSTASFLAFAAIEPTMVTENYGPKLGGNPAEYHGLSLKSCANYIPSRDPIFGALRKKHQSHIMRTADAINMSFGRVYQPDIKSPARGVYRVQDRYAQMYAQFHEMVEDVRKKEAVIGNDIGFYEKKCENTGQVLSPFDALREFKERVWPHYSDGIRSEYIKEIDSEDEWHSEDEWYSDDEY